MPTDPKSPLDTLDTVLKCLAVVVGGAWTWLNYVRGRTFRRRLEIDLTGSITEQAGVLFFNGLCTAKNVGLSKIPIQQRGTGVSVYMLELVRRDDGSPQTTEEIFGALPLFKRHGWIEPGETISDPFFVVLRKSQGTLLGVRTVALINNGKTVWSASQITEVSKPKPRNDKDDKEEV